jgi:uncharacterized protein (DUF488 family)
VYTIGHSTRTLEDLIKVLKHYNIESLVDVRHFPHSRHNPQFNKEVLEKELPESDISYLWLEKLGGFRSGGYKKYTKTEEFKNGIEHLISLAHSKTVAIMCAEILWLKCHRRYVSDELKRRKLNVVHIYDEKRTDKHRITKKGKIRCDKPQEILYISENHEYLDVDSKNCNKNYGTRRSGRKGI